MNAALFMLTSAWMAGADAAPAAAAPVSPYGGAPIVAPGHGPAIISTGSACSSCGGGCATACDTCDSGCGGKAGLFSKFKGMWGGKKKGGDCCDTCNTCAPTHVHHCKTEHTCCAPAPTCGGCATACNTCDSGCGGGKGGLFGRFKGMWGGKKKGGDCCDTCNTCNTCGGGVIAPGAPVGPAVIPGGPVRAPEPVAPPKEIPKKMPGKVSTGSPSVDATPTVNPKPIIEVGGPGNPF